MAAAIARQRLLTASFETYRVKAKAEGGRMKDEDESGWNPNAPLNPKNGFIYRTVPHITLKSIAQNKGLDPIFARHEPILAACLAALNTALAGVTDPLRQQLTGKLIKKLRDEGARTVTDADQRRWLLPGTDPQLIPIQKGGPTATQARDLRAAIPTAWMREDGPRLQRSSDAHREPGALPQAGIKTAPLALKTPPAVSSEQARPLSAKGATPYQPGATPQETSTQGMSAESATQPQWAEWEVPFDTDPDWPAPLREALTAYRTAWRAKMDEVNAGISANAEQEELVDQPEVVRGVVRVSGPFTVESIRPPENSPEPETPIGGAPEELETFDVEAKAIASGNAGSHIDRMLDLLRHDGITFLGNKHVKVDPLQRIESSFLHAEGEFVSADDGKTHRVAVVIGPELGSVPGFLVEQAMRHCYKRGYDDLVVAGFSFDAMAQEAIQDNNDDQHTDLRIHMAQIRPDVTMGDLLKKTQVSAQIFTVFGQPRTRLAAAGGGEWQVHMEGVDIYDPVKNSIEATNAGKVAAWFVDTDYDGKVFCICQAFFPDKSAWEKLARALKGSIEEGAFDKLSGTISLPFKPGERQTVAVKVIDPRGNEVMRVHRLGAVGYGGGE